MSLFNKGYIQGDTLTACGLTAALYDYAGEDYNYILEDLSKSYGNSYVDNDMKSAIKEAYEAVKSTLPTLFNDPSLSDENYAPACKTLTSAISNYNVDGNKRRPLFNGSMFKKNKKPIQNIKAEVAKTLLIYHAHLQSGKIKL